jgi:hypothetical protein
MRKVLPSLRKERLRHESQEQNLSPRMFQVKKAKLARFIQFYFLSHCRYDKSYQKNSVYFSAK